jgi:hypothetical protein
MAFKYTMTAEPYYKLEKTQIYDRKTKKHQKVLKKVIAGYYPIYKRKLGEIEIWSVKAPHLQKSVEEAKAFAKERLTRLLTKGSWVKVKHTEDEKMVEVYSTMLNPETGQVERRKY